MPRGAEIRQAARVLWPYLAAWALIAFALVGTASYSIFANREREIGEGKSEIEGVSRLLQDHAARVLADIDRTLGFVKLVQERHLIGAPVNALLEAVSAAEGAPPGVAIIDRNGRQVAGSVDGVPQARVDVSNRRYFIAARENPESVLQIAPPSRSRGTAKVVVPAAKRLESADGEFDGIVLTGIDTERMAATYRRAGNGADRIVGVGFADGAVITRTGTPAIRDGVIVPDPLFAPPSPGPSGDDAVRFDWRDVDGAPHLIGFRSVPRTELVVFVGLREEQVFESHSPLVRNTIGFLVVSLVAVSLPFGFVGRRALRESRQHELLARSYTPEQSRARTDSLTGIANRAAFDDHLRACHQLLTDAKRPFVLAFLDVDLFKQLNDTQGHATGDRALKRIARTLKDNVRQADLVARLGSDEFAILMPGAGAAAVRRAFDHLRASLGADAAIEGWPITFSIGVVAFESAPARPRDAVNLADGLMYDVKAAGRDGIRYATYRNHELLSEAKATV